MKPHERIRGIYRAPQLLARIMIGGRYDFVYDQMPIRIRDMSWSQRVNLARSGLNLVHRRLQPWSLPLHMQFELVNYCQLHCPVCPAGTGEVVRQPRTMDPALFRKVMREVGPRLLTMSLWGWGESLLHPALGEFLSEARRYNAAILLSTNGQYLDRDEVIAAILEHPPTFLIVAIDGLTDETNSRFRVGACLEPVLRGIKRLVAARESAGRTLPILHMRFIVMKHNQHELPEVEAFAAGHGFDLLTIRTLSLIDSEAGRQIHSELAPDLPEFSAYQYEQGAPLRKEGYICMQPFWFPSLFADGTLVACEQDFNARRPLGVLGAGIKFADLWFSGAAANVRRQIRDASHTLSFCRHCPSRDRASTDTSVRATWLRGGIQRPAVIGG
jgi:MoaA/NifB/PqqE/SkfB family radical SAM enzyme